MQNQPLISIIMGIYNGEKTLDLAIESIKEQTYKNWEFIICDDGSSDNSFKKLEKYKQDKRFKIIRNTSNIGLAATLNKCISMSKGEYIARMDGDDISYSNRFEKQLEFLENNLNIGFVSSTVDIYDGEKIKGNWRLKEYPLKKDLLWNSPFVHPATMFRRDVLKKVNGYRVAEETLRGQDYDLFMRLYGEGYRGANLLIPVYRYTIDNHNLRRRTFSARLGEIKIRKYGFQKMKMMPWAAPFILKPIISHVFLKLRIILKGE